MLQANYPAQAGDSDQIVVQAKHGTLRSPATEAAVTSMLARVAKLPDVGSVTSPYGRAARSAPAARSALATVNLDDQANSVPTAAVTTLISTAQSADSSLLNVQLGGGAIENIATPNADYTSVLLGIVLALVVLFFAFRRSVYGALLPLISALVAIGVGTSIVNILTHAISIASWVPWSPSSWRSAWAWTTRCSSSAGTATGCSPGRRPRTPPSPRSTPPAAPCCWPG